MRVSLADKARRIKPFVNFSVNVKKAEAGTLDAKTRALIEKYFRIIDGAVTIGKDRKKHYESGVANGLKYELRPATKDRAAYEKLAGQAQHFLTVKYKDKKGKTRIRKVPGLKGVWFDTVQGKSGKLLKPKVRLGRGKSAKPAYSVGGVQFGFVAFDPEGLVSNASKEVRRAMAEAEGANKFAIKTGKSQSRNAWSKEVTIGKVGEWMELYEDWEEWMLGLVPLKFTSKKSFARFQSDRRALLKSAKLQRAKDRRAYEKLHKRSHKKKKP